MDDYLVRLGQDSRLQPWQCRQAIDAIRNRYGIVDTEWARVVNWGFWRDSARTLEEQQATTAREHAPVIPEEFAKRIGESRFAPLIREHLDVFARFSTVMRTWGLSIRTEKSYLGWCCRFLARFGGSRPENLGASEVAAFLEELAVERNVSASTQNQALNALVFLYDKVLERPLGDLGFRRARGPRRLPIALSQSEVKRLLAELRGTQWLIGRYPDTAVCLRLPRCGT